MIPTRLESLERWSARATLAILLGIVVEIGSLFWFQHEPIERLVGIIANALIGIGLVVEYIAILTAIVASGDANRESDEKVAEASKRAAEAELELARYRAWRRLDGDAFMSVAAAMKPFAATPSV